ncbi:MAG TPA: DUF1684 domain-containing protein [Cyclobacteriaceae bacterium]|jgi:hypothetical protein|nr:DUF1684 domain-containing protein [Cyclobacteriaceae bacterium]
MKLRSVFIVALILVVALIIFYSFQGNDSGKEYEAEITKVRVAKDNYMGSSDESPFGEQKKNFKKLNYFPINLDYRISAKLVSVENKKVVVLPTSDNLEKKYLEYAFAEFELNSERCKLLILEIMEEGAYRGTLFLAFADGTSANETYGAGRYLDVKKVPGASSIILDFNQAYNPYCAYSEKFSCPFPPRENVLKVSVRAGEKKYHD